MKYALSDLQLNKKMKQTKEKRWWRFFSSSDRYDPDQLNFDKESLRRFYLDEGFVDFEVTSAIAELRPERDNFYLTFFVDIAEAFWGQN